MDFARPPENSRCAIVEVAGELANVLREAGAEVPTALTNFGTHVKKKESKLYGAHFKEVDMSVKAKKITFD